MKETYLEMKKRHEEERKAIKWGFAFSDSQFKEMMSKWGLTVSPEDLKKIVSIGYGGFIQKKDIPEMKAILDRQKAEEKEHRKHKKFLKEQILYEMGNHEYIYTYNDSEIFEAIGISEEEKNEDFFKLYAECRKIYLRKNIANA